MSKNSKRPNGNLPKREPEDLQTIAALKRIMHRMHQAGLSLVIFGFFMPKLAPFYAAKTWKLLIGVTLPLPKMFIVVGCLMLMVSIFCFLRSYRCPHCGSILALTSYTKVTKCRSCGAALSEKDHYQSKGE